MGGLDTQMKERAETRVGRVLRDKWQLDRLIGIGGMAAVYAGTHRNGKLGAIKVLHPEAALIPDVKARFLREGYLANRVNHPGAVSILDDDVDADGTVFLVMELLHGETLETRWNRDGRLDWEQVSVIADRILDVLILAHQKEIVHRDLKPGNIFINTGGAIKILDFGIARLQTVTPSRDDTGRHLSLGTPGFMPPEQARGHWNLVDGQSDLWALGATMFSVLSGRYVHEAATVNEQLLAAMTQAPPPIRSVLAEMPEPLAEVVDKALRYQKTERFLDAASMQQALRAAYEVVSGRAIALASPLTAVDLSSPRTVHAEAPTIAASEVDPSQRFSSARSLANQEQTGRSRRRTIGLRTGLVTLGLVTTLAFAIWTATRSSLSGYSTTESAGTPDKAIKRMNVVEATARHALDQTAPDRAKSQHETPAPGQLNFEPDSATTAIRPHGRAARKTFKNSGGDAASGSAVAREPPAALVPASSDSAEKQAQPAPAVDIFTRRK